jgi:hypothetical protein
MKIRPIDATDLAVGEAVLCFSRYTGVAISPFFIPAMR